MKLLRMNKFLIVAFALLVPGLLSASPINGTISFSGGVRVTVDTIDWLPPVGGGTGQFQVEPPDTGYFAGLNVFFTYTGNQTDLGNGVNPPQNGFLSNLRFLDGSGPAPAPYDTFQFDLLQILLPGGPACSTGLEASCSLGVFSLRAQGADTAITLRVSGYFEDQGINCIASGGVGCTPATGVYTTQLSNVSIGQIMDVIISGNGFIPFNYPGGLPDGTIQSNYSAQFSSVPEPATYALIGLGLLTLAVVRRRSKASPVRSR